MPTLTIDDGAVAAAPFTAYASPMGPEIGRAFVNASMESTPAREQRLHDAVVAHALRLKADDFPPERVVISLKKAIAEYGTGSVPSLADGGIGRVADIYRRTLVWCLEAYFDSTRA